MSMLLLFSCVRSFHFKVLRRSFTSSRVSLLNRVLFNDNEVSVNSAGVTECTLPCVDHRSKHIREILKLETGDNIRVGVLNKFMCNTASVTTDLHGGYVISINRPEDCFVNKTPKVDLILAVPRPERLLKLLPILSCLGVGKLILVGAKKVEKAYFGSHLFTSPELMSKHLADGLAQAEVDCLLPKVEVYKSLSEFLLRNIDTTLDLAGSHCLIAHPPAYYDETGALTRAFDCGAHGSLRVSNVLSTLRTEAAHKGRIVLAIGPEGGWEEGELQAFTERGFHQVSLGSRILRTDMAVQVAMGCAHEWADCHLK